MLFIGVSVYGAFVYNSSLDTQLQLENEKNIVLADLSNLTELYEEVIADNSIQNTQLIAAQEQIETLYNELKSANRSLGQRIGQLTREQKEFEKVNGRSNKGLARRIKLLKDLIQNNHKNTLD